MSGREYGPALKWGLAIAVAAVVGAVGVWAQNAALVGVNYDDGIYALLARAVASGDGYRLTHLPGALPGIKYPPLYPLSLVPFWSLYDTPEGALHAMKLANGAYIGVAAGLFTLLCVELGMAAAPLAAAIALLAFVSGSMMLASVGLLSEPLYLVTLFLALWASDAQRPGAGTLRLVAAGGLAGLAALTRMVGLALLLPVLFAAHRRAGRRGLLVAGMAAAVPVVPWLTFTVSGARDIPDVLVPRYGSYLQLYAAGIAGSPRLAWDVVATNVGSTFQTLGVKLAPWLPALPQALAGVAWIGLAVLGSRRLFKVAPATAAYPWLYLAFVSTWSYPPFRFVFVLIPLLLALTVASLPPLAAALTSTLARSRLRPVARCAGWARPGVFLAASLLAANLAYREVRSVTRRVWDGAELRNSTAGAGLIDWVLSNTDPEDVIAFEFDPLIALHTGRQAVPNNYEPLHSLYRPPEPQVEMLARLFREMGVDYVAVRRDVPLAVRPIDALAGRYPNALQLVFMSGSGVLVFRVDQNALAGPPSAGGAASSASEAERPGGVR